MYISQSGVVWIQDFAGGGGGGGAFETESCQHTEVSYLWLGLRAHLRALETFGF